MVGRPRKYDSEEQRLVARRISIRAARRKMAAAGWSRVTVHVPPGQEGLVKIVAEALRKRAARQAPQPAALTHKSTSPEDRAMIRESFRNGGSWRDCTLPGLSIHELARLIADEEMSAEDVKRELLARERAQNRISSQKA